MSADDTLMRAILLECGAGWLSGTAAQDLTTRCAGLRSVERFVSLADEQGMTAVVLDQVQGVLPAGAGLSSALREGASRLARRNLELAAELVRLMGALEAEGVRALAYKGPVLALKAYGDLAMRRYCDLDVLVHPADVPAASAVLARKGFAPVRGFSPGEAEAFRRLDGDYQFVHGATGVLVELHCRVASRRFGVDLPTAALWAESAEVELAGRRIRTLSPRHHVLVSAVHAAKHRWLRLEWLVSFAALARTVDVDAVRDAARSAGAGRELELGLTLSDRMLGTALVTERGTARDATVSALADRVAVWLRHGCNDAGADANLLFNFRLRQGAMARLRYTAGWLAPTPEDWRAVRLPTGLHGLHRVLRPMRLLWRYAPRAWRRGRGAPAPAPAPGVTASKPPRQALP